MMHFLSKASVMVMSFLLILSHQHASAARPAEHLQSTNDVFFFVGSPLALLGATVELSGEGFYESFVTTDPFSGEIIADVPFGTYTYTISKDCYDTVSGSVEVNANDGMGISVFANPMPATTNNVFFFVGSPLAMLDATVELYGPGFYESFVTSDPWSGEFIADVPFGEYTYSVSKACHETVTGTVVVDCNGGMGVSVFATPSEATSNDVFFFVGSPLAMLDATVELYGPGFYESFVTSDPWSGEFIADVPFGEYTYSVSKACHETVTGTVTVDCNGGMGVSVFATPSAATSNDVFFFVGSPLAMLDATVELYGPGFYESFVTSDPWSGEFIADVPFGEYTYSVSKACHETVTGTVTVDCNGGMGVSVFATPSEATSNDVFFFVGSPLAMLDATVELYAEGYYESFVTSDPWSGEFIADVPYGEYTYSVSKDCHETVTGTVTVDCNGGMGVSVFATPSEATSNDVFFFVGSPLAMLDATVELTGEGFYQSFVTSDPWSGEFIADVPYGEYTYSVSKDCHETVTGTVTVECNGGMGVSVFATPTAITFDTNVMSSNGVLSVAAAAIDYQWLDCDNDFAPILGGTGATFAPAASGNYAVELSAAGCSEISACVAISLNSGCTYPDAENYDATATVDDGSCTFNITTCAGDLNGDGLVSAQDLLSFLSVFGTDCE